MLFYPLKTSGNLGFSDVFKSIGKKRLRTEQKYLALLQISGIIKKRIASKKHCFYACLEYASPKYLETYKRKQSVKANLNGLKQFRKYLYSNPMKRIRASAEICIYLAAISMYKNLTLRKCESHTCRKRQLVFCFFQDMTMWKATSLERRAILTFRVKNMNSTLTILQAFH